MKEEDCSGRVLDILASVTEEDEVRSNPSLPLYDRQVLDSMKTVELMIEIENAFGIEISPAEFDRESWATPAALVSDIEERLTR
jgi:D-alanine--poly(phosphoribitol) ligase subunit 2